MPYLVPLPTGTPLPLTTMDAKENDAQAKPEAFVPKPLLPKDLQGAAASPLATDVLEKSKPTLHVVVDRQKKDSAYWEDKFKEAAIFTGVAFGGILGISVLFALFQRKNQGGTLLQDASKLGKKLADKAKEGEIPKHRFSDLKGMKAVIQELQALVNELKNVKQSQALGLKTPTGIFLYGPPGTGKSQLAKAFAGEAGMPLIEVSYPELGSKYINSGSEAMAGLFREAKAGAASDGKGRVIFIDELFAGKREDMTGGSNGQDEDRKKVDAFLKEMSNITEYNKEHPNSPVVVIAASNFDGSKMDDALMRPGRFTHPLRVGLPSQQGRIEILQHYLKNRKPDDSVRIPELARRMYGKSGAALEEIVNQAASLALRDKRSVISQNDLIEALTKQEMGVKNMDFTLSEAEMQMTRRHEWGHALARSVLAHFGYTDTKTVGLSVEARSKALGVAWSAPKSVDTDKTSETQSGLLSHLISLMSGRSAEALFYPASQVSTGASNDLEVMLPHLRHLIDKTQLLRAKQIPYHALSRKTGEHNSTIAAVEALEAVVMEKVQEISEAILRHYKDEFPHLEAALKAKPTLNEAELDAIFADLFRRKSPDALRSKIAAFMETTDYTQAVAQRMGQPQPKGLFG